MDRVDRGELRRFYDLWFEDPERKADDLASLAYVSAKKASRLKRVAKLRAAGQNLDKIKDKMRSELGASQVEAAVEVWDELAKGRHVTPAVKPAKPRPPARGVSPYFRRLLSEIPFLVRWSHRNPPPRKMEWITRLDPLWPGVWPHLMRQYPELAKAVTEWDRCVDSDDREGLSAAGEEVVRIVGDLLVGQGRR